MPDDPVTWWTAFGALAQAGAAIATFVAVVVSLWIALSGRAMKARGHADIMMHFIGDGSPGTYLVGVTVLNVGIRAFEVSSVGWRTGWFSHGPGALRYRHAIQKTSMMLHERPGPYIVEPGRNEGFYTPIADMKHNNSEASRNELFNRQAPILGYAPIRAIVNITGRKPLIVKVTKDLAEFLRTGEHASTTAENAE